MSRCRWLFLWWHVLVCIHPSTWLVEILRLSVRRRSYAPISWMPLLSRKEKATEKAKRWPNFPPFFLILQISNQKYSTSMCHLWSCLMHDLSFVKEMRRSNQQDSTGRMHDLSNSLLAVQLKRKHEMPHDLLASYLRQTRSICRSKETPKSSCEKSPIMAGTRIQLVCWSRCADK